MISFGDKIRAAKNDQEVNNLLEQSKKLTDATEKTRRRWKRLANTRLNELSGRKEMPTVDAVVAEPTIESTKESKRLRKKDRAVKENIT